MKKDHQYGDAPIEPQLRDMMEGLARGINELLNGPGPKRNGFVLMIFPFEGFDGRCNYISNGAAREDVVTLMKEQIARFEGQPEVKAGPQ